jgi:hypothetical protein
MQANDLFVCAMPAGHYVSLIKSKNTWLYFDDDSVDLIPEATVAATFGHTQVRPAEARGSRHCVIELDLVCWSALYSADMRQGNLCCRIGPTQCVS